MASGFSPVNRPRPEAKVANMDPQMVGMKSMFESAVRAGFTEEQAMEMITKSITAIFTAMMEKGLIKT